MSRQVAMDNDLIVIDSVIQEHEAIHGHMRTVIRLVQDRKDQNWESLTSLSHKQLQVLNKRRLNLKQTMSYLDEGLRIHWAHEDAVMPQLIGEFLIEAIRIEHSDILKQLKEINFFLAKSTPQDFLNHRSYLQLIVTTLCELISEHETKENMMLNLLKRRLI